MTAEVAIINRQGVAIAADSAVTIRGKRVWLNSNKIFSLGPHNDIGIMIYGVGDFYGASWETVIKEFRHASAEHRYKTVDECRLAFIEFLKTDRFRTANQKKLGIASFLINQISILPKRIDGQSLADARKSVMEACADGISALDGQALVCGIDFPTFKKKYSDNISALFDEIHGFSLTKAAKKSLLEFAFHSFTRAGYASDYHTGIVFAGFGSDQMFPVISSNLFDGLDDDQIRFWEFDLEDHNDDDSNGAIVPFAQQDMTHLFMEGVVKDYLKFLEVSFATILGRKSLDLINSFVPPENRVVELHLQETNNQQIVEELMSEFRAFRHRAWVSPVMQAVSSLPKEEMAAMAEAIVDLQSLRRKIDSDVQTVSGPIDVAVISKGDGFIWIKRKHYFNPALNGDFMMRKQNHRGHTDGE